MDSSAQVIVAQISDPHVVEHGELLFDRIPTNAHLEAAVRCLASLDPRPDLVVVTGDLVNEGRPAQYRELRRLLEPLAMPVRLMCGNHDDPVGLREVFADHGYLGSEGPIDYVVDDVVPLRIVALDTHVPGEPGGHLTATQLAWHDARLGEAADRPCLVALHHPPFATGIAHMDEMGLTEAATEGLRDVVSRHPQVERVICGHLHRTIAAVREGMESLRFNTSIARITELTNHLTSTYPDGGAPRSVAEPLALLIAPMAPHLAEELWARLGRPDTLAYQPYPEAVEDWLIDEALELPVSINGKVRGRIQVPTGASAADLEAAARADARIGDLLEGATVRKVIAVPDKMVNFVVA